MRGRGDVVDGVRVRDRGQEHLQHPDDVAPVRHRSQHAGELAGWQYLQPLGAHHLLVGRTGQRHRLGGVPSLGATARPAAIVAQPDHRVAAGVGDEEADFLRGQPLAELSCEHVHSSHRRRDLHRSEQRAQLQAPLGALRHAQIVLASPSSAGCAQPPISTRRATAGDFFPKRKLGRQARAGGLRRRRMWLPRSPRALTVKSSSPPASVNTSSIRAGTGGRHEFDQRHPHHRTGCRHPIG